MTISRRIAFTAAAAVAIAIVVASIGIYFGVKANLREEIDATLKRRADTVIKVGDRLPGAPDPRRLRGNRPPPPTPEELGGAPGLIQIVSPEGEIDHPGRVSAVDLPVDRTTLAIARGIKQESFSDATVKGTHLRIYTQHIPSEGAIQVARPLDEVDSTLDNLALLLLIISLAGVTVAGAAGALIARWALAPIRRFADETETVASQHAIGRRIEVENDDEIGRLAKTFNSTLDQLEESTAAQRQLVADASHELRTPLASIKTNIQLLQRTDALTEKERNALLNDVTEQVNELAALTTDIVELARKGEADNNFSEDVPLQEIAEMALKRAELHWPKISFVSEIEPFTVRGIPERLDRAIYNLLDNAAKWSPEGGTVELKLSGTGELTVRDHGPGFSDEDLPHLFDRFYRAPAARSLPGSGLGLAIVKQVAETHAARVVAENASDGGACLRIIFTP